MVTIYCRTSLVFIAIVSHKNMYDCMDVTSMIDPCPGGGESQGLKRRQPIGAELARVMLIQAESVPR